MSSVAPPLARPARSRGRRRTSRAPRRADVCIVGGAGRVGLPLALALASKGCRVLLHDINAQALDTIRRGVMPFAEEGADPLLAEALAKGRLAFESAPDASLAGIPTIVVTVGTPMDEFMNPTLKGMVRVVEPLVPSLTDEQLIILRSTVYPGTTEWLDRYLRSVGRRPKVACCPERIVQGHAIRELQQLPQLVSGTSPEAEEAAAVFFAQLAPSVVRLRPMEAEFAKLFCNAYRYIQFAVANQLYMMVSAAGLDYYRILEGMQQDYPRLQGLPGAGLSAGPCLLKDTMQLNAFGDNGFSLGSAAMFVNEGLPLFIVNQLAKRHDLSDLTVGLLGMAFKADSDDARSSLSYKLKKVLRFRAKRVLMTDPHVQGDPDLVPLETVVAQSDLLILCIPHQAYRGLDPRGKPVVDVWNFLGRGGLIS